LSESVNKIKKSLNNMRGIRVPEDDPIVNYYVVLNMVSQWRS